MERHDYAQFLNAAEISRFRGTSASGYPFFLPSLFGSGADGDLTATTQTDVGHLGSFGIKEYKNLIIPAGVTWTVAVGTSSGALILGVKKKLTIAGSIIANGANGNVMGVDANSNGGGTAGGGAGGLAPAATTAPVQGSNPSRFGHGAAHLLDGTLGRGAPSGVNTTAGTGAKAALATLWPISAATATTTFNNSFSRLQRLATTPVWYNGYFGMTSVASTITNADDTSFPVKPATADYGPWAQVANTGFLSRDYIPPGPPGSNGGTQVSGATTNSGGGGGGGGVVIIEAETLELTAGYLIRARGGTGCVAGLRGGASSGGCGGNIFIIYRNLIGSTASIDANAGVKGAAPGIDGVAGGVYFIRV